MPQSLTCPNGHEFPRDPEGETGAVPCPVCAAETPLRKGLWEVMGQPTPPSAEPTTADESPPDAAPKGLWSLMGKSTVAKDDNESPPETGTGPDKSSTASTDAESAGRKGLWSLMKSDGSASARRGTPEQPVDETDSVDDDVSDDAASDSDDELEVAPLEELADEEEPQPVVPEQRPVGTPVDRPRPDAVPSGGARKALLLGILALPAAALSLLPELWLRIPANLLGFLSLMIGLFAVGEIRRSRGRLTGRRSAIAGMTCGVLALMLGPFVFTQFGEYWRRHHGRTRTANNLQRVGDAMNAYHSQRGEFPSGKDIRRHNWQTLLLPHLGEREAELYQRINLQAAWDADDNRAAMGEDVSVFFASGANRQKVGGYAVTHFAALGGRMSVKDVGLVNVGVFDADRRVSRADVTDGREQTLVAGEIVHNLPPWGEPNKYRQIGQGLNRGRDSFGNSDRTGAMFLRADGSVRFFSNETDLEILKQLSTRDGREKVDAQHYR